LAWDFPSGPMQEAWVQSLVREVKSHMPQDTAKKKKGKLVELRETDKYIIRVVDINPPFSIINNLSWQKMIKGKLGLNIIKLDLFNNTLF